MKTRILGMLVVGMISSQVMAGNVNKWTGTGAIYSADGQELSTYQINVVNTEVSAQVTQSVATTTSPDGTQKVLSQTITSNAAHGAMFLIWVKAAELATENDICENYISGNNGFAYATTIVSDSAGRPPRCHCGIAERKSNQDHS